MNGTRLKKTLPIILSVVGVIGVGVTAVLSARDTNRCRDCGKEPIKEGLQKTKTANEKAKVIMSNAKAYTPTIVSSVITSACVIGSIVLSKKAEIALITAYGLLEQGYKNYRDTNIKMNGKDMDHKIKVKMAEDSLKERETVSKIRNRQLFYDDFAEEYFEGDFEQVLRAEYCINKTLIKTGCATLNQFYRFMGKKEVYYGDDIGWSINAGMRKHYNWIGIEHNNVIIDGDLECMIISFSNPPAPDFI